MKLVFFVLIFIFLFNIAYSETIEDVLKKFDINGTYSGRYVSDLITKFFFEREVMKKYLRELNTVLIADSVKINELKNELNEYKKKEKDVSTSKEFLLLSSYLGTLALLISFFIMYMLERRKNECFKFRCISSKQILHTTKNNNS